MIDERGEVLITDFGLAAVAAWGFRTTLAGRPLFNDETLGG